MNDLGQMNAVLSAYGVNMSADSFNWANLFIGFIFGIIGFYAFNYGRKERNYRPLVLGIALMAYPYFVSNTWLLAGIGIVLTTLLYFWKE